MAVPPALLSVTALLVPIVAITVLQYQKYGFGLFLGWDTSRYVWWAELVRTRGPLQMILTWNYPNLYTLSVALLGSVLGSNALSERILPPVIVGTLGYAYYRLAMTITSRHELGYLASFLAALTLNTLRMYSDLHRNLLAFGVSMLAGVMLSGWLSNSNFSWKSTGLRNLSLWVGLLAIVAYTQIETYAVLALALFVAISFTRNIRTILLGLVLIATPVIAALPLLLPFFEGYSQGAANLRNSMGQVIPADSWLWLGGYAIPFALVGIAQIGSVANRGNSAARFVASWLISLGVLSFPAVLVGLPILRLALVLPLPILFSSSVPPLYSGALRIGQRLPLQGVLSFNRMRWSSLSRVVVGLSLLAVLFTSVAAASVTNADQFIRPYLSQGDVNRLTQVAGLVRQMGYDSPILVMYGSTAAWLSPLYASYFGIDLPDSLPYYGKLQFVFTLPEPSAVYNWRYNPAFEQVNSEMYRSEILSRIKTVSEVTSHPIVVVEGDTYGIPISESFASQFQVGPGIYVIPPGRLSAQNIDNWRLFAYFDWTSRTASYGVKASWAVSPLALEWSQEPPMANFEASYTVSLAHEWPSMELDLHYWDWPPIFSFQDGSSATLAPLDIYFDNTLVSVHSYSGTGPATLRISLEDMKPGIHRVTVKSGAPMVGVAIRLDYIQLCPLSC